MLSAVWCCATTQGNPACVCPACVPVMCVYTGRHASVLNLIVAQLPSEHPAAETMQLQETLGHTPLQVLCGAAVGLVVGVLVTSVASL